jgi:hypothetical protein
MMPVFSAQADMTEGLGGNSDQLRVASLLRSQLMTLDRETKFNITIHFQKT